MRVLAGEEACMHNASTAFRSEETPQRRGFSLCHRIIKSSSKGCFVIVVVFRPSVRRNREVGRPSRGERRKKRWEGWHKQEIDGVMSLISYLAPIL